MLCQQVYNNGLAQVGRWVGGDVCIMYVLYMYLRMYVCMHAFVRTYVCMYVRMCVCTYVGMYICMYVRMYVYMHISICISMYVQGVPRVKVTTSGECSLC